MLKFSQYVRAESLEQAYTLCQKRSSVVLGGMLWLKMQNRTVGSVIDLCDLHLDTIEETETEYRIGAMVSLRALETHPGLNTLTHNAFAHCLSPIVGVQFRNGATIGGSVAGRFGFSDPLTLLLALGAKVEFYKKGVLSLEEWLDMPFERDILTHIILPRTPLKVTYLSQRISATDFPVLTCAVCQRENKMFCAVGARPMRARLFGDDEGLLADGITEESARRFAESIAQKAVFGPNLKGSAEYRRQLCRVLVRRALLELKEEA